MHILANLAANLHLPGNHVYVACNGAVDRRRGCHTDHVAVDLAIDYKRAAKYEQITFDGARLFDDTLVALLNFAGGSDARAEQKETDGGDKTSFETHPRSSSIRARLYGLKSVRANSVTFYGRWRDELRRR